jgi:hypothetical protein
MPLWYRACATTRGRTEIAVQTARPVYRASAG